MQLHNDIIMLNKLQQQEAVSSGATPSAGRAKKDWGRCWVVVVAVGVAWDGCGSGEVDIH